MERMPWSRIFRTYQSSHLFAVNIERMVNYLVLEYFLSGWHQFKNIYIGYCRFEIYSHTSVKRKTIEILSGSRRLRTLHIDTIMEGKLYFSHERS